MLAKRVCPNQSSIAPPLPPPPRQGINGGDAASFSQITLSHPYARYTHVFSCPACTLSSVSTLELALDRLCQHVSIDVGCVDAEGGFYSVSNAAGASSPLLSPALAGPGGTAALTEVSLTVPLALSALNDLTDGTNARGFVVQPQSIDVATTAINATGEFLAAVGFVNITVKVRGARRNTQQQGIQHTHTHTNTRPERARPCSYPSPTRTSARTSCPS